MQNNSRIYEVLRDRKGSYKSKRCMMASETIRRLVAEKLNCDEHLAPRAFVSKVEVSNNLDGAVVYLSVGSWVKEDVKEILRRVSLLDLKSSIARGMRVKRFLHLNFKIDDDLERIDRIESILRSTSH